MLAWEERRAANAWRSRLGEERRPPLMLGVLSVLLQLGKDQPARSGLERA